MKDSTLLIIIGIGLVAVYFATKKTPPPPPPIQQQYHPQQNNYSNSANYVSEGLQIVDSLIEAIGNKKTTINTGL